MLAMDGMEGRLPKPSMDSKPTASAAAGEASTSPAQAAAVIWVHAPPPR
jgi:hypothetical protein